MTPIQILIAQGIVCLWAVLIIVNIKVKKENYCDSIKRIKDIVYGRPEE